MLLLSGCASTPKVGGDPQLRVLGAGELPMPERSDVSAGVRPHLVGPLDKLSINVLGIEELSQEEVQVDASGRISVPLAGQLLVSGMTPGEIEALLTERLQANFVRDPVVTVNFKEAVSQIVTVEGEVKKPGLYPVVGDMTLLRAIAKAEGTTEFTNLDDVIVFRVVGGQRYAALYNLKAIRHGVYPDPQIFANDVVTVGESRARRIFKDLLQVVPALSTPIIVAVDRL